MRMKFLDTKQLRDILGDRLSQALIGFHTLLVVIP